MSGSRTARSQQEIEAWLAREIADVIGVPDDQVERDRNFLELGVSSRRVVSISGRLQKWLGVKVPPTIVFEYPTIEALAAHLSGGA
jgi:phthiocerol/phenolphthiocerol synthesis type-I polyketide synthase D